MVDFQSRDTRRGPPLDDEEDEPDDEGDPPDEPAADEETDPTAEPAADEERDSHPADGDPDGERTDDDTVDRTGGPEASETAAETGSPTEAPSSPPAAGEDRSSGPTPVDEEQPSSPTPVDEEPPSTGDGDAHATDPLDDRADAPSPAGESTATRQASEAAAPGDEGVEPATDDEGAEAATTATPETTIDVAVVTVGPGEMERVEEAVAAAFEASGHAITVRERLRGEYDTVQQVVDRLVSRADVDTVVTAGGIGIAADERTIEAVHPLFAKALPGFGEAFRALLFEEIGTGIVAVRSTAGVADGTLVFCLPGDAEAARLAVEEILVPEAPELVAHLR